VLTRFIFMFLCFSNSLFAGGLKHMFDQLNVDHNFTGLSSFQDQAAGHYTGGGLYMRSKNKTIQPIQVSLPHLNASGCSKIDMYLGAMSFMRGDELWDAGKAMLTGSAFYAASLALKTKAPQVYNTLESMKDMLLDMNKMMANSCQMSQQLVGAVWPKDKEASTKLCEDLTKSGNSDSYAARKHCAKDDKLDRALEEAKEKHKDLLVGNYNLVWHAIKKTQYIEDKELAEFVMTLVGTIISLKENSSYRLKHINGKADSVDFIEVYLKGGQMEQLRCNNDECLNPTYDGIKKPIKGLTQDVSDLISEIKRKYLSNEAFSDKEIEFITETSNLPVYKYIQVSAAAGTKFITKDVEEYIALSIMLKQFDRILGEIIDAIDFLAKVQVHDSHMIKFRDEVKESRRAITKLFTSVHIGAKWKLDKAIKAYEQAIITRNM